MIDDNNREDDATAATAGQLNTINAATATAVNLTNVTALASSSLDDLGDWQLLLHADQFCNATGLTTIAVSDTTVDATTLAYNNRLIMTISMVR